MGHAATGHPSAFLGIVKLPVRRRNKPRLTELCRSTPWAPNVRKHGLTVRGYEGIKEHEVTHSIGHVLKRAGHHEPSVRKAHKRHRIEVFIEDVIYDISHVGAEIDQRARQMRSFAEAGERRGSDLMALALQLASDVPKAARATPSTMNEYEIRHSFILRWL